MSISKHGDCEQNSQKWPSLQKASFEMTFCFVVKCHFLPGGLCYRFEKDRQLLGYVFVAGLVLWLSQCLKWVIY